MTTPFYEVENSYKPLTVIREPVIATVVENHCCGGFYALWCIILHTVMVYHVSVVVILHYCGVLFCAL